MVTSTAGFESVQGRRVTMEDTHVVMEDVNEPFKLNPTTKRAYYAVYDGHGGKNAADMTADLLHKNIITEPDFINGNIEQALTIGFDKTDKTILAKAEKEKWSHGTTTVVCVIIGDNLYIANTGDSEAVLAVNEGGEKAAEKGGETEKSASDESDDEDDVAVPPLKSVLLTEKHKPNVPSEKKRIEEAGGQVVFGRVLGSLAVSRALGDMDFKHPFNKSEGHFVSGEPYVQKHTLTPANPFIVIACDGLWDKVTYEESVEFVAKAKAKGKNPTETAQELVKHALELGSFDNITIIIVYLHWDNNTTQSSSDKP